MAREERAKLILEIVPDDSSVEAYMDALERGDDPGAARAAFLGGGGARGGGAAGGRGPAVGGGESRGGRGGGGPGFIGVSGAGLAKFARAAAVIGPAVVALKDAISDGTEGIRDAVTSFQQEMSARLGTQQDADFVRARRQAAEQVGAMPAAAFASEDALVKMIAMQTRLNEIQVHGQRRAQDIVNRESLGSFGTLGGNVPFHVRGPVGPEHYMGFGNGQIRSIHR